MFNMRDLRSSLPTNSFDMTNLFELLETQTRTIETLKKSINVSFIEYSVDNQIDAYTRFSNYLLTLDLNSFVINEIQEWFNKVEDCDAIISVETDMEMSYDIFISQKNIESLILETLEKN